VHAQGETAGRLVAGMIANLERQIGARRAARKDVRDGARRG
jgi:hypothetical protein